MPRYVDKDWLLERAIPMGWSTPKWVSDILIEDAPTADVVEVRHGKWEIYDSYKQTIDGRTFDGWCECSNCQTMFKTEMSEANYCPYCGAKMDL